MNLSVTATACLVCFFLCCDLGCCCWTSFLVGSHSPLAARIVAALVAPCRLLVASLPQRVFTIFSLVAMHYLLESFICSMFQCCYCYSYFKYDAVNSLYPTYILLDPPTDILRTQAWRFCTWSHTGSAIGVEPVSLGFWLIGALERLGLMPIWSLTRRITLFVSTWNQTWALINGARVKIL